MTTKLLETLTLAERALVQLTTSAFTRDCLEYHQTLAAIREQKAELESYGNNITSHNLSIKQEPVAWFVQYKNRHEFVFGNKPEFIVDGVVEPLYAAPVRTKDPCNPLQDLTDDEIRQTFIEANGGKVSLLIAIDVDFARAVIAADRRNNK